MQLTKEHFERLADYFADVSKGLFLGAIATQSFSGVAITNRLTQSVSESFASFLYLYLSLLFTKEKKNG